MKMTSLKYTVIKDSKQYESYCDILENMMVRDEPQVQDEVELLTLLIEKWDKDNNTFSDSDPIEIIKNLMEDHGLKPKDLVEILDLSKGTVSKILNYHKGLSKETIRRLSEYFKLSQEAFNRPYKLINEGNRHFRNEGLMKERDKSHIDR